MQMSEEGKARLMVLPVVAMLVVTMMVAGWQQGEDIEVDEGTRELTIEHCDYKGNITGYNFDEGVNATALTTVDNKSELEFEVHPISVEVNSIRELVTINLSASGQFEDHQSIESFKFRASEKYGFTNAVEILSSYFQIDGGERWPDHEQKTWAGPDRPAYEGYDLNSSEFTIETKIFWEISTENMDEEFTLELEAVVEGLSEDVSATVLLHIEGGDE